MARRRERSDASSVPSHVVQFQMVAAACATITMVVAAFVVRTPSSEVDHSNLVALLSLFGVAAAVTGSAGGWLVRCVSWGAGLCAVVGLISYLVSVTWVVWPYAAGALLAAVALGWLWRRKPSADRPR